MQTQETYTVVIEKRHCEGRDYKSNDNCPLCAAIKEQLLDFKLKSVGGDYIRDINNEKYYFEARYKIGWAVFTKMDIESGRLKSHTVIFSKELLNNEPEVQSSVATFVDSSTEDCYKNISKELAILPQEEVSDLQKHIIYE